MFYSKMEGGGNALSLSDPGISILPSVAFVFLQFFGINKCPSRKTNLLSARNNKEK